MSFEEFSGRERVAPGSVDDPHNLAPLTGSTSGETRFTSERPASPSRPENVSSPFVSWRNGQRERADTTTTTLLTIRSACLDRFTNLPRTHAPGIHTFLPRDRTENSKWRVLAH